MESSDFKPLVTSLAVGQILSALLTNDEYVGLMEERIARVQGELSQITLMAEWHLNQFSNLATYGEDAVMYQSVSDETVHLLNWLIAPLGAINDSVAFEAQVNRLVKTSWLDEVGDLSASVIRDQEVTLLAWSLGKPLWRNGRSHPARLQMGVLTSEINLAYSGLMEHLASQEQAFLDADPKATEIARTSIAWRFAALFEALADSGLGPKRSIEQIVSRGSKSLPEPFRKSSPRWNEELVKVRHAFSHIVGSLKPNYGVPDIDWTLKLIENGTLLTSSALSYYYATEISDQIASGWWGRAMAEMDY